MPRSDRLLELIQFLRTRRRAVGGAQLADEFGVSLRTIYRDIQTLIDRGAPIEGQAGVGYVLRRLLGAAADVFQRRDRGNRARLADGGAKR